MSTPGSVERATLEQFRDAVARPAEGPVTGLEDVAELPVTLALEVGRRQITIRELLQLTAGSVVELDRTMGDPLDVLVNGTLLAHGEAVVVNEKCAVKLTDLLTPAERGARREPWISKP